jgi:NHL repeat-containing protein
MSIRRAFAGALSAVLLVAFTACARENGASPLPAAPAGTSPLTVRSSSLAKHRGRKVRAKLIVKVPHYRHHRRGLHHRYVSPATASLQYQVDSGAIQTVAISTSNPNCTVIGPISYLQCNIDMTLSPGQHTFAFSTFDANGNLLSANTSVSYTVRIGAANQIPVILGGIAASLSVTPIDPAVSGSQNAGYTFYGSAPEKFSIVPVDADDNFIVGAGAPQPSVASAPANTNMSTPSPKSPNVWTFTSTYSPTDPTAATTSSISAQATPVPNSGGTTVTASVPLTIYTPEFLVWNGNAMQYYDEQGNPGTTGSSYPASFPGGLEYDAHNGLTYITNTSACYYTSSGCVVAYNGAGVAQTLTGNSGNPFPMSNAKPYGLAYDSHNGYIYVVDFNATPNTIDVFDEQGNAVSVSGTWAGLNGARNVAFDPSNDLLYVTNCGGDYCLGGSGGTSNVTVYDEQGNQQSTSGSWPGLANPIGIAYDSNNGDFYVADNANNTVKVYDAQGNAISVAGSWANLASPIDLRYDPNNHLIYVASSFPFGSSSIDVFDEQGNAQTVSGNQWTTMYNATHMVLVGP